jgi:hypothetical protein
MKKRIDEGALLDKLGAPPGMLEERVNWLYTRASPDKVVEYAKATTDPDACHRCFDKKAEGYFQEGRFVREPNREHLRELCNELLGEVAPVCAECGDELRIDGEMRKPGVLTLTKILLTSLATACCIIILYSIDILDRWVFHRRAFDLILVPPALAVLYFYWPIVIDIWKPSSLSMTRRLYQRNLKEKRQ